MSEPVAGQPSAGKGSGPTANTVILIVGLSLVAVATIVGLLFALNFRGGPVDQAEDLAAGRSVSVEIPNAALILGASDDDDVHVTMRGTYLGAAPTLEASTSGGVTTIGGGCPRQWFNFCQLEVTVTLPASLPLTAAGENGAITTSGLTGELSLHTTNGRIEATGTESRIDLRSTNGAIRVREATSAEVSAGTTNASVDLGFLEPPDEVVARSTNGSVTVRVPVRGVRYSITARTTNGSTNTNSVPGDRDSEHRIVAETTNGSVSVIPN
ncbi:Putative adhesin [Cryobacterium psychrotolerans]|uniref:Putative adhesin n=1 Tax=Cryobacterium psychrotolerans TaxID=386301 RepID=A0A1G8ZK85_9MICO|nr:MULTISPECIES: DUF4097 family beta strand repeat-containing protein [Cryobacterium]TFD48130.1 hypothetical protein E3T33_02040 [Cryobacterium sp. TMT1-2-1]TFD87521.1 hypothetical protein E3T56_05605 [Cryobacterium psychrotolerans]SDK15433.1 Putative adhesin [Cryobacterium psychrotolerans]